MDHQAVLAVDIGGTKIAAGLVGPDGVVRGHAETATPANEPLIGEALRTLLTSVAEGVRPRAVGLASAGPLDLRRGTVSPVNIPAWRDFPLVELAADIVPGVPVTLVGDGIAAAVGEHWRGAGRGSASMLGIVVSTGIGGGLVLNGVPYPGPSGNAGHLGHTVVDPAGPLCTCGAAGCVEAYASGPSMVRWARRHGWSGTDARGLATDAGRGDPTALAAFDQGTRALARGIVAAATLCDLDRVVIGGGVSAAGPLLFTPLRRHVERFSALGFVRRLTVQPSALGRQSGLLGAARSAMLAIPTPDEPISA
ncbi:sugar kinase [Spongiactinospora gelatinilytica]|uniref:Sugar kinase n=1 Tax=Spongiactinospora gelatinilytica TaxID=2666298 RepID=A0A2W2GEU8_9ACTN|nr:ROK family protein [Spongiactinospora gelatinilytica]PZG41119.1 sugar kinase [Spongiactinospora gelatinilytica]